MNYLHCNMWHIGHIKGFSYILPLDLNDTCLYGVKLFSMAITIPTIYGILPLRQGMLHMNHGGKTII